jgi:aminobenzoyl-glutamate transport protein
MKSTSYYQRFLNLIEKVGNALPHPATLFLMLALTSLLFSWIGYMFDWQVVHPNEGIGIVKVKNLLSIEGLHYILKSTVTNFTSFAPLGIVLVAMLGIGIAEKSGLISALIRMMVLKTPAKYLTFVLVFSGIMSNFASDIGYVLLIPLGAIIFKSVGRHPIAGMAACFAGVSGGFSANLIIGTIDPLLAGLSQEAAQLIDPNYIVNPTCNYYFMFVSTIIISLVGTFVTEKIVVPRLGKYDESMGSGEVDESKFTSLSKQEKKGIKYASLVALGFIAIIIIGLVPEQGFLRSAEGSILKSPVIKGVVTILFLLCAACGIIYGKVVGLYKNDSDVMNSMAGSIKTLASYIVLVFFAAQFVAYFKESQLGIYIAVTGAEILKAADLNIYVLMLMFIIFAASLNMLMGSASAKWAILAPVFIPIFMTMGYSPELSQVVFRIGDSVTNIISPMMSFFALIIAYFQQYDRKSGIGTIMSCMIPYSIIFFIAWSLLLFIWIYFEIPLGPGSVLFYN